jgi:protein PsiE
MVKTIIAWAEKGFLITIAFFTVAAMLFEVRKVISNFSVELKDLLLMFIYAEVLGMLAAYYGSHKIPITIPLFIAITALSRLLILQGKDNAPATLLFESGSILLIALGCVAIGFYQKLRYSMAGADDEGGSRE